MMLGLFHPSLSLRGLHRLFTVSSVSCRVCARARARVCVCICVCLCVFDDLFVGYLCCLCEASLFVVILTQLAVFVLSKMRETAEYLSE